MSATQPINIQNSNPKQQVTKLYSSKRTPTSFAGTSHENITPSVQITQFNQTGQALVKSKPSSSSKDKTVKLTQQAMKQMSASDAAGPNKPNLAVGHQVNF